MALSTLCSSPFSISVCKLALPKSSLSSPMAHRASSSSSSSTPRWIHDVFLSFHGEDTRLSFTDNLGAALTQKGIFVFSDDKKLKRGTFIAPELMKAIEESKYAIIVFSRNYAFSRWCLIELAKIVECMEENRLTILPVFYHVNPSDVRKQKGTFAEAFSRHEKDPDVYAEMIQTWRDALKKVGDIAGWDLHNRNESTVFQEIGERILGELTCIFSSDSTGLVGIETRVKEMMNLLTIGLDDVRFVGICGMGGVGKTTLAEVIFERIFSDFKARGFVDCVREENRNSDLVSLQNQLLCQSLEEREIYVGNVRVGIQTIRNRLRNRNVLIVLNDVDTDRQLEALAGQHDWFGPGSRIIFTSRDRHLLEKHGVKYIYNLEGLDNDQALQLFSLSAFKERKPKENYVDLSMDFVNYCQGLPLALKVLGSSLYGRETDAWKSAMDQLQKIPNREIFDTLHVGFDGLEDLQKKLFLDIACFFKGNWQNNKLMVVLESFGYYPEINIGVLLEKSLITIAWEMKITMHDLLQKMGQEIVRRQCPEEPGRRSRLWSPEDVLHVLKNNTGTDAVEGIVLDLRFLKNQQLRVKALSNMKKLRFLQIYFELYGNSQAGKWLGDALKSLPTNELKVIELFGCPLKSLPSSFPPNNLVVLSITYSHIKQLWKGSKILGKLKCIDLSFSENLIETPDFTGVPNLEILRLEGCRSLSKVHPSIGVLKRLRELNLNNCKCLKRLPDKICLESLKIFCLDACSGLETFPDILGDMTSLWYLFLTTTCKDLPLSFSSLSGLRQLYLVDCKNFSIFPSAICSLSSLEILSLFGCSRLEKFPDLSRMECLVNLSLDGSAIIQIPSPNLLPKNAVHFRVGGCQSIPRDSRLYDMLFPKQHSDPIIGTYLQYCGNKDSYVDAMYIDCDSERVNILHMGCQCDPPTGGYADAVIYGSSLGYGIPKWFLNKSNGSSVTLEMDLDGNRKWKGFALFIVYQAQVGDSIHSIFEGLSTTYLMLKLHFETDEGFAKEKISLRLVKLACVGPIGFWVYIPSQWFLERSKSNNLDGWSFIKASISMNSIEVKECGARVVYPDEAPQFYNSIASLGFGSQSEFYRNLCWFGSDGVQPLNFIDLVKKI